MTSTFNVTSFIYILYNVYLFYEYKLLIKEPISV